MCVRVCVRACVRAYVRVYCVCACVCVGSDEGYCIDTNMQDMKAQKASKQEAL